MIPNDLLDLAMRRDKLDPAGRCVLLYLIRQTFGYNRADSSTFGSIGAIASATGYGRVTVINAIKGLLASGLVVRSHHGGPGKGSSVYAVPSTVGCTSTVGGSTASYTTPSTVGYTTPSTVGCTLKETRNKQVKDNNNKASSWMEDLRAIEEEPISEGRIDIADLRQRLGMRISIADVARPKWIGISQQDPDRVEELLAWAAGTADPASAFAACFDTTGTPKAKRRGNSSGPPGETLDEKRARKKKRFAEMAANLEREIAEKQEAACRR